MPLMAAGAGETIEEPSVFESAPPSKMNHTSSHLLLSQVCLWVASVGRGDRQTDCA